MDSWSFRLDTIDLGWRSVLALSVRLKVEVEEKGKDTLGGQIDQVGIESGVALRGGKAHQEGGEEESGGQHVDLVAQCLQSV